VPILLYSDPTGIDSAVVAATKARCAVAGSLGPKKALEMVRRRRAAGVIGRHDTMEVLMVVGFELGI